MKKISTLVGIIIIIVVAIILFGGVFAYQYFAKSQPVVQTQQNQNNQTAGWKTYTNTQYGFEFQYPKEITFSSSVSNSGNVLIVDSGANQLLNSQPAITLSVSTIDGSGENKLKEEKNLLSGQVNSTLQEITIGGSPAIKFNAVGTAGAIQTANVVLDTFKDKYFYSFMCVQDKNNPDVCNQIISTFKFTK